MQRRHGVLLLAALVATLFSPFLLRGRVFVPQDFLYFVYPWKGTVAQPAEVRNPDLLDIPTYFFPLDVYINKRLKRGEFPLWNPQIFCGHPLFASGQSGLFYPPKLILHRLFSPEVARTLSILLHSLAAAWLMFSFLRLKGLSNEASTLGGVVWILNGQMSGWAEFDHIMMMATYVPLMLLGFEWGRRGQNWGWPLLAVAGSLCLQAGHLQLAFYAGLVVLCYAGYSLLSSWRTSDFLALLGTGALVVLMTAPTLLPFVELLANSAREDLTFRQIQGMAASLPTLLATLLHPDALGKPTLDFMLNRVETNLIYPEFANYFGTLPLLLALGLSWRHPDQKIAREGKFWTGFAIVMLLFACASPLYRLFVLVVFPLAKAIPGRSLVAFGFATTWLAAQGLDSWLKKPELEQQFARGLKVYLALAAAVWLLTAVLLYGFSQQLLQALAPYFGQAYFKLPAAAPGPAYVDALLQGLRENYVWNLQSLAILAGLLAFLAARREHRPAVLIAATALELSLSFWTLNPSVQRSQVLPETPAIEYLQQAEGHFRIEKYAAGFYDLLTPYGLQVVTGYDSLVLGRVYQALAETDPEKSVNARHIGLRDFTHAFFNHAGLRYLMVGPRQPPMPQRWQPVFEQEVKLFENPQVLPRAYLATGYEVVSDLETQIQRLNEPDFVPDQTVLLEREPPAWQPANEQGQGSAEITSYQPEKVLVKVETQKSAFLVLNDAFYPDWIAIVDGQQSPLLRANGVFRAVPLGPGNHQVEFLFRPASLGRGLKMAAAGVILALVWLIAGLARGRRD